MEISNGEALVETALDQVEADDSMPQAERDHAAAAIEQDSAEALSYLIDPFDLVAGVPGVELTRASWRCTGTEYDTEQAEQGAGGAPAFFEGFEGLDEERAEPATGGEDIRTAQTEPGEEQAQDEEPIDFEVFEEGETEHRRGGGMGDSLS